MENEIKNKKSNTSLKAIILIFILSILFVIIRSTYSKYITQTDNKADLKISNWHITINDQDISKCTDFTEYLNVIYDENENIAENVIVPTSSGHFDITLNSTGTELPFAYEFSLGDIDSSIKDFRIVSYSINDEAPIDVENIDSKITGTILPDKDADGNFTGNDVINKFTFNLKWFDVDSNTEDYENLTEKDVLDNFNDVAVSKLQPEEGQDVLTLKFPITLRVTQILEKDIP